MSAHDDEEDDEIQTTVGRADAGRADSEESQMPAFLVPDPEYASGWRYYYVKRPKPGQPPRRMGFR